MFKRSGLENAAAIMFNWMDNAEAYDEMYDFLADQVAGFVGIQCEAAKTAKVFSDEGIGLVAGEHYYGKYVGELKFDKWRAKKDKISDFRKPVSD